MEDFLRKGARSRAVLYSPEVSHFALSDLVLGLNDPALRMRASPLTPAPTTLAPGPAPLPRAGPALPLPPQLPSGYDTPQALQTFVRLMNKSQLGALILSEEPTRVLNWFVFS